MAVIAGMTLPVVADPRGIPAASALSACAGVATTALGSLCVESSTDGAADAPYVTGVDAGDRIDEFKWLVNEDDSTGDPSFTADNVAACLPERASVDAATAASNPTLAIYQTAGTRPLSECPWPSVHASSGHSAVIASGDQTTIAKLANLALLGNHKYLVSVTAAGHKIDGVHFEVRNGGVYSVNDEPGAQFIVRMNPLPKKTATVRVHVYNDNASTNGQWDGQTETLVTCADATPQQVATNCGGSTDPNLVGDPSTDMSGFSVHINDVLAETTTDVYGSPLCTQYVTDSAGNVVLNDDGSPNPLEFNGGATGGALAGTDSTCLSDHFGDIVIPNMGPNRYAVTVVPPDPSTHNGDTWVQTTTLEGGHDWDSWNIEGGTGYDTELIVGGERVTPVAHGFVRLSHPDDLFRTAMADGAASDAAATYYDAALGFSDQDVGGNKAGTLTGRLMIGRAYIGSGGAGSLAGMNLSNAKADGPITDGLISISCLSGCSAPTDTTVWTGRADPDGNFAVTGLETGDYSVAFWDESQSYILAVLQYSVTSGETTRVEDVLLPGWFTDLTGTVFYDLDHDGFRDAGEPGIPDFTVTERTRGNSLQDQGAAVAVTNDEGEYDLGQGYPLGQFLIAEGYNPRYKNTGFTYTTDNDSTPHTVQSAQVDIAFLPIIGLAAHLDWGVQAYGDGTDYWSGVGDAPKNENGGIVGTVSYDVTRNEFDPAFSAQEDYQPGVAGIPMQLWKTHTTNGVVDTYPSLSVSGGTGAVQQWGIDLDGNACMRPDAKRGTDAVVDGSQTCKPYDYYVTESWTRPVGCEALDVNGDHLDGELALPDAPATVDYSHNPDSSAPGAQSADCLESPMSSFQIGGNGTVDGNYALTSLIRTTTMQSAPDGGQALVDLYAEAQNNAELSDPLTSDDYVVEAVNPVDAVNDTPSLDPTVGGYVPAGATTPNRLYRFTDEKSINVFTGDTYVPQEGYVAAAPGDGGGDYALPASANLRADANSLGAGTVARCAGGTQVLPANTAAGLGAINPDLNAGGGNPYQGRTVPVCDAKLVTVAGGRSVNPGFFIYTDVPIPSKFYGLVNDDLNVNVDRRSILLGEVAPASNVPVGVYDENGNWKLTTYSDVNGFYEILLPSMDTYNCPLPAGPCANVYRLVGNDPGTLAHRNLDYNPQFRTIATEFQAWTGVVHPVDQAPTHIGITIEGPAAQFGALSLCKTAVDNPTLFAIDRPYFDPATDAGHPFVIKGSGFGALPGTLSLGSTNVTVPAANWTDTQITFTVPAGLTPGPYQLAIANSTSRLATVNGLTFHRLSPTSGTGNYLRRSDVYEVTSGPVNAPVLNDNPGARVYTPAHDPWDTATNSPEGFAGLDANVPRRTVTGGRAIQRAVEAASAGTGTNAKLVVVYPNLAANYAPHNPNAAYFENLILHGKVKIQGVGPGGATSSTNIVYGTTIDASQFWSATQVVASGANADTADGSYSDDWRTFASGLPRAGAGPADIPEGAGILAIARTETQYGGNNAPTAAFRPGVDGVLLTGGDQQGNPAIGEAVPGSVVNGVPAPTPPGPAQGGAVMIDQYVRDFAITNDQIQSNGGTYGTIRIGTPDLPGVGANNHNDRLIVSNNRIVANGGTNLAGALGIFAGATGYVVSGNDFCGNFSAEYGGAISHYGLSDGGKILKNRIYYNQSYDEGGGIMIAGSLPANTSMLSPGAGSVTIDSNTLISNQSNDDGGGIRFLMANGFAERVINNIIANNLATHEGGGIALDDSTAVTIANNTIVKNITTGTAATNGALDGGIKPANPAGVATGANSALLQAVLGGGVPNWSKPSLINNIFADNRAGWAIVPTLTFNASAIHGIGGPDDPGTPIQRWDVGVSSKTGLNNGGAAPFAFTGTGNTTNATTLLTNVEGDASSFVADLANNIVPSLDGTVPAASGGVGFAKPQDFLVDSLTWRNNPNTSFPVIVAQMVPVNLLADYHLVDTSSTVFAINTGLTLGAPDHDIDGDPRPGGAAFDRGADERVVVTTVDMAVTKSDAVTTVERGQVVVYTIVVSNSGPDPAVGAAVSDIVPSQLQGVTWTCSAGPGGGCGGGGSGSGNVTRSVTVPAGGTVTFVVSGTVSNSATSLANTATVTKPAGTIEVNTANNSATDTDTVHIVGGDLRVTKTANKSSVSRSGSAAARTIVYTATVTNPAGADLATGATFTEFDNPLLTFNSWSCTASAGSSCGASGLSGTGRPTNRTVNVAPGGTVTFSINATAVSINLLRLPILNLVTVTPPGGYADPVVSNNTATALVTVTA